MRGFFAEDLQRYERLRQEGSPAPAGEAFQYAWLARCDITEGDYESAEVMTEKAGRLFEEFVKDGDVGLGTLAHYRVLKGAIDLGKGNLEEARSHFNQALEIRFLDRETVRGYLKGEADALKGIAATCWADGRVGEAIVYGFKALKTYPLVFACPFEPNNF